MAQTTIPLLRAGFAGAVLVCKACEKRSKGPKGLAAKDVVRRLKHACRGGRDERLRVVATGCLGACPKKAMTVAALRPGRPLAMVGLRRDDGIDAAAAVLLAGPPAHAPG